MGIPTRLIELLNQTKVRYQILHHPEAFTAQELAAIEHVKGHEHAKVVIVKIDGAPCLAVLPADHRVDLDKFQQVTGRASILATEADFKALFPDCAVGAMPPFGNLYGLETYVDTSLTDNEQIVFEAGTHSDALKMSYADFERTARPKIADFGVKVR